MQGAAAYVAQFDANITDTTQILGVSIKGGREKAQYFTIRGNYNGTGNDLGPTKNKGKIPGMTLNYSQVNYGYWAQFYTEPLEEADEPGINMPSSCVEIYDGGIRRHRHAGFRRLRPAFHVLGHRRRGHGLGLVPRG